ncbi:DUF397 domain-containing protein [Streptomyces sp. NPDC056831]|uniref:DUF397 domain-containing protein n=1 Tax=Streptomyces sp. NPDC056831 TaxID=3345954 RepID=UPI0036B9EECC
MPAQPRWFTSSYSGSPNNECVECAIDIPREVRVRDSKAPDGPQFTFGPSAWAAFTQAVRMGNLRPQS